MVKSFIFQYKAAWTRTERKLLSTYKVHFIIYKRVQFRGFISRKKLFPIYEVIINHRILNCFQATILG